MPEHVVFHDVTDMIMRPAEPSDLETLRRWDAMPHVVANRGADDLEDWETELARRPDWREWLIAEVDGRPIGIVQILDPARDEDQYWGEIEADLRAIDIWIGEPGYLNRGHGTEMMRQALVRCFADSRVAAVLIDPLESNIAGRRFYERLGFKPVGPRRFGEDDCMVYRLERREWGKAC